MKYDVRFVPENNKGLPNFRPWQVTIRGEMVHCYTHEVVARAASEAMNGGKPVNRHKLYRGIYGKARNRR